MKPESRSNPIEVMVVGAGPAGSSLAAALARMGRQVVLVEKDRFPRHKVCGEFLSPEAQNSLHNLGVFELLHAQQPVPLQQAALFSMRGRGLNIALPGPAWGLSRYTLDHVLAQQAVDCGVQLWEKTTVTGWQTDDAGFTVQLHRDPGAAPNQQTVAVSALVMACGRHSRAGLPPNSAQGAHTHRQRHVGVKVHYANLPMEPQVELYFFAGGYAGINPVETGHANVCLLASYAAFAQAGGTPAALIEDAARQNPALAARLQHAHPLSETSCVVAPVDTRRSPAPWAELPVVGDAAAMIAPLCGDGMAMALRTAELCAPLLESYLQGQMDWSTLGAIYARTWRREFQTRLRLARWLEHCLLRPGWTEFLLRVAGLLPPLAGYLVTATRGKIGDSPRTTVAVDNR